MDRRIVTIVLIVIAVGLYAWKHQEINAQVVNAIVRTRGYLNNNPGNIRPDGQIWKGEISPSKDPSFKQFQDMGYGYRAIFVNLRGYLNRGINTINSIISTWAPPSDNNDTYSYINSVSADVRIDPDDPITLSDVDALKAIAKAISKHENGVAAIPSQVDDGWAKFLNG